MSEIEKYKKYLNFKANPRYLTRDFIVPLYTGTEPDILDDSNTQRESSVYKEFPNDMPIVSPKEIQNQPYEQLQLNKGGSVERRGFKTGGDVQNWAKETYPNVNFDFEKYPNTGVGSSDKNYAMVKKAINKKLENPNYFKPSLDKGINNIADAFLKSYAKDDVSYLTSKSEFNKNGMLSSNDVSFYRAKTKSPTFVQDIVDKTGLKAEDVLDLIDERENFIELDLKPTIAGKTKQDVTEKTNQTIRQGEDWLIKNSKNYDNVEDLKKGFKRVLGKDHPFLKQTLRTSYGMPKLNPLFYEGKQKSYQTHGAPAFTYGKPEMENLFKASLYNFNPAVRDKVLNELNDILPKTKITEGQKYDLRKKFENSKIFSELGINKRLSGPVTRLLIKDLGENIVEDINFVKTPRLQVGAYINFLKDKVDPKYKKQFELVNKAIRQLNYKNYNGAKDTLGIVENINLDHRVPKYLIDAGYADELEYIKLNPIGENFNMIAKNKNFDAPIARLSRKYEATNNPEDKTKIIKEMNNLKNNFNKRYNNYLSDISIKEVEGKLNVSSSLKPVSSADELIKNLETNVKENPNLFKLDEKIKTQMIANIGCPTIGKSLGGRVNFSNGSNCYAKGLEKIQSGELGNAERRIAGQFLKEAGVGDELVKGMLTGGKNTLKVFQELALGTGPIGTLIGTTLTVPFAAAESARGSPGGFGRELVSSLIENVNIIPGVDIDAAKLAGTQVTQALERSARPGSQKMANYLFPIQEQSKEIDNLNKKLERFTYLRDNPSIESSPVSDQQVKMIQEQIDEKKLTLQNLTNNLKKNITGEDLNDVKKDITALQAEAFKRGKNIADLRISNVANPEIKKYVQENPNRIVLNAENIPTFINNLSNEYGESARPLIDQITKNFENIKTLGQQGEEETGILSPSGFIDVTDIYNDFLKKSEGYKTILDKQDVETKPLTEDQRISIEEMGARGGAAEGGRIGLSGGGGPKIGRRGFLGLLTGAAAAPELIKALKGEKKAVQAAKVLSKIKLEKAEGMYPWFPDLVEKIKTKGKPFEEKEIIMEASYKHEPKGYGGLPKGEETVTRHVDGDTEFLLREYPDGRIAVDIHSPRNQEGSSTPVTLYYRPTMELKYYSGVKVEPAEFKVLEKEPRYFANGPDDVDIEMSETRKIPGKNTIYGDVEAAERFATGKIENRKIIPAKQARREQMEDAPTDFIEETSPYGPVYD
jgi:hypothetical protein